MVEGEQDRIEAAQGNPALFGVLYEETFDTVYAYIARRVGNRRDAEDLTSTVYQRALAALPAFEWRGTPFVAWLVRIAANEIARDRGRHSVEALATDPEVNPAELAEVE